MIFSKASLSLFFLVLITGSVFSQENQSQNSKGYVEEVKRYTWDEVPAFGEIPAEFLKYPAVVLKDYRLYDNRIGEYTYKSYVVKHCAVKILEESGINDFNKVSIDKKYVRDYRDLKARVIKPNGIVENLSKEKIVEKSGSDERYFVFEGVEKGDIIEYYYVIKDYPDLSGVEYFQRTIPVLDCKFQINGRVAAATTFVYGVNGMEDHSLDGQKVFTVDKLPAYKFERDATNYANLTKVYFFTELNANYGFSAFYKDLVSYADSNTGKSMIKKFVEEQNLNDTLVSLDKRLQNMDVYVKENLELGYPTSYKKIFEEKKITTRMVLNLYKDVLDYLKVPYNFYVSTDRFDDNLNKADVIPQTFSEIMLYVPSTNKYFSPFNHWMPYGAPSWPSINNDAIKFLAYKKSADFEFVKIDGVSMNNNIISTISEVSIQDDMETVNIHKKYSTTGYYAYSYRNRVKYLKEDKIKDFVKNILFQNIDLDLDKYVFENKEYALNYEIEKPFTIDVQSKIRESWIENAGKNYLFSIGKVLGKQNDLYQEKERVYPVDINFPKKYQHTIKFNIPTGYSVKNLDNLMMSKQIKDDKGGVIGSYISKAIVEGNTLILTIEEFYDFTHLEVNRYNEYRDLINTAFDFYKSSIILNKNT